MRQAIALPSPAAIVIGRCRNVGFQRVIPKRLRETLDGLMVLEPGTLRRVTPEEPEAWLRALPTEFRPVYLRAVFSD